MKNQVVKKENKYKQIKHIIVKCKKFKIINGYNLFNRSKQEACMPSK